MQKTNIQTLTTDAYNPYVAKRLAAAKCNYQSLGDSDICMLPLHRASNHQEQPQQSTKLL